MQAIRLRAVNNTRRENLIQCKNLKNKILAAFDVFGVFTQIKFLIQLRQEMFKQGHSSSRYENDGYFSEVNKFYGKM